jgi:hypothetical protein
LIRVLADGDLRRRLAAGGRAVAARHTWPAIAEQTESALAGLIDRLARPTDHRDQS